MKYSLAYIDDNPNNLDFIGIALGNDFDVSLFQDASAFLTEFSNKTFQAIIIDIHMPNIDGFMLYEKVIESPEYNGCPIIFISSDDSDTARIKSFALGAVDFLNRFMTPNELVARIHSKILFFQKHRSIIEFGNLKMNLTLLKAHINQDELKLTFIEFKMLCHFLKNYPEYTPKEELFEKVWTHDNAADATYYTHMFNLNSKLKDWDHEVLAVKNKGSTIVKKQIK